MATKKTEETKTEKKTAVKKAAPKAEAKKPAAVKAAPKAEAKKPAAVKAAPKAEAKKPAAVKAAPKAAAKKPAAAKAAQLIIQSPYGGNITPEEILAKVGKAEKIYIRVDENKAYWVRGKETGSVDLWD